MNFISINICIFTVIFFSPSGKKALFMFSKNANYAIVLGIMYIILAKFPLHRAENPYSFGTPIQKKTNDHNYYFFQFF